MSLRLSQHQACPALHVGLRLPFAHSATTLCVPHCVGTVSSVAHCHARSRLLYPRGPRSGLGSIVPVHLRLIGLIRPTHRHIPISPQAAYTGCLRCAGAPRRPASGSVLSLRVPSQHAVLYDRGESVGCLRPVPSPTILAFTRTRMARHSQGFPSSASDGTNFRRFTGSLATACRIACPPGGSDRAFHPAIGGFYSRAFDESVALLVVGYNGGN
jgi:hypothetical protein